MPTYTSLQGRSLQPWYSVEIVEECNGTDGPTKAVYFHSTIHKNMPKKLTFCFSWKFTDHEILRDHSVVTAFIESFGADAIR